MSIRSRVSDDFEGQFNCPPGPYPGLRATKRIVTQSFSDKESFAMTWGLWFCWVPDIPFSFCLDTICLPYDVFQIGKYKQPNKGVQAIGDKSPQPDP